MPVPSSPPPAALPPPVILLRRKREEPEDEGWLITFADMSVLLMCFFVILFSMSSPDAEQFKVVSQALRDRGFFSDAVPIEDPFNELRQQLVTSIGISGFDSYVTATESPKGIDVEMSASALFAPGSAIVSPQAAPILELVAKQIMTVADRDVTIDVEGFTDDSKLLSQQFPSNWELSCARAAGVVRFLIDKGVPASKLRAIGLGETHPKAPNHDAAGNAIPANQDLNRRVVVKLLKGEDL